MQAKKSGRGDLNSRPKDHCVRRCTLYSPLLYRWATPGVHLASPPCDRQTRSARTGKNKKNAKEDAPPLGIEPRTCRLTAERSTNWAMEADVRICKLKSYWTFWVFQNSKVMRLWHIWKVCWHLVREVKEADSKSAGLCPRRFESCRCRSF